MIHTTHIFFSFFITTVFYEVFPFLNSYVSYPIATIVAIIGALIPDLDHPNAYLSRGNWYIISHAISKTSPHRGWTHSLLGSIVFSTGGVPIVLFLNAPLFNIIPFFMGYLSHLISDSLNPTGVNWLYPKKKRKYGLKIIRTGSKQEGYFQKIILFGLVGIWVFDVMYNNGNLFSS
jgi:inner membrane protein